MSTPLLVVLGGAVGASLRYLVAHRLDRPLVSHRGTFLVNVTGSLLLGWLVAHTSDRAWSAFLGIGLCGALTTYSAVSVQAANLGGRRGLQYAVGTVLVCVGAAWLGTTL